MTLPSRGGSMAVQQVASLSLAGPSRAVCTARVRRAKNKEMGMAGYSLPTRGSAWVGMTLAVLVVATAFPLTALGAERMMLGELFQATW